MFVKGNGYLYASYYCQDGRLRYPTGIKVGAPEKSAGLHLQRIEKLITQYVESCKIREVPILKKETSEYLNTMLGKSERKVGNTFFADLESLMEAMRSGQVLKKNGDRYSGYTVDAIGSVGGALKKYEAETGYKFSYNITKHEYDEYLVWLTEKGYSRNTIAGIVGYLNLFLGRMFDAGNHKNEVYKKFVYSGEEADTIYLTLDEITNIFNLKLKGAIERARDVLVFGCWVGLRVKDLNRINEYERRGNVFEILTSKTGEKVVIPIHWMADKIYIKYNGVLPVFKTPEALSYHLPKICRMANITERHLISITKGGSRQAQYYDKCDLVSPHTFRRSFASNMYLAGFRTRSIMKVTGHRTEKSFFKYIRIDKEETAQMMLSNPYLKEPTLSASDPSAE